MDRAFLLRLALRQWSLHRVTHVAIILVLGSGLLGYSVYGAWNRVAAEARQDQGRNLFLPAQVAVVAPEWMMYQTDPVVDLSAVLADRQGLMVIRDGFDRETRRWMSVTHQFAHVQDVLTGAGQRPLWTVPGPADRAASPSAATEVPARGPALLAAHADLRLEAGRWPTAPHEVAAFAGAGLGQPGDVVRLRHISPLSGVVAESSAVIVGVYSTPTDMRLIDGLIAAAPVFPVPDRPNALLLWFGPEITTPTRAAAAVHDALQSSRRPNVALPWLGGAEAPLPFISLTAPAVFHQDTPTSMLTRLTIADSSSLFLLMSLVFAFLFLGVAVLLLLALIDHQQTLGVLKAIGFDERQLRRIYVWQIALDVLLASVIGIGIAVWQLPALGARMGVPLSFHWGTAVAWSVAGVLLTQIGGRVAEVITREGRVQDLLKRGASIDWWELVSI